MPDAAGTGAVATIRGSGALGFRRVDRLSHILPAHTGHAGPSGAWPCSASVLGALTRASVVDITALRVVLGGSRAILRDVPLQGVRCEPVRDSWQGIGPTLFGDETYTKRYVLSIPFSRSGPAGVSWAMAATPR